jgi:Mn-dependent DtxR family transcriptional regulator
VGEDAFPVTHEFLAAMLGVQRTTVSLGAGELQQRGLISISRGRVTIRDREGLKRRACECHRALRRRLRELLPFETGADEPERA